VRKILLILWLILHGWAIDTSNMFFTTERFNPYADPANAKYDTAPQQVEEAPQSDMPPQQGEPFEGGKLSFVASGNFVWQFGYDKMGNGIMASAIHTLPNLIENYPLFFAQADVGIMFNAMQNSTYNSSQTYVHIAGYGGYTFAGWDDRARYRARVGVGLLAPINNFVFGAGGTLEYDLGEEKETTIVADLSTLGWVFFLNVGVKIPYAMP